MEDREGFDPAPSPAWTEDSLTPLPEGADQVGGVGQETEGSGSGSLCMEVVSGPESEDSTLRTLETESLEEESWTGSMNASSCMALA